MNLKLELQDVKRHFFLWFILLVFLSALFCSVSLGTIVYHGHTLPSISEKGKTLSALFFIKAKEDLLPPGVELIATSPITVFLLQLKVSFLTSFVLLLPYLLISFIRYISPALFPKERRRLIVLVFLSTVLFLLGMFFAYKLLVFSLFKTLLAFNVDLNVAPFLAVDEFISWTLASLFVTGLLFLLPVFMYTLAVLRVVTSSFWIKKWREMFILFLIIAAIITPDVSGLSIFILSLPAAFLYFVGIISALVYEKNRRKKSRNSRQRIT